VKRLLVVTGAASALAAGLHYTHRWGATPEEHAEALPGDELIPEPAGVTTRAVTVDAAPAEVWAWLVQIGQDRGGMYSYDWLENIFGLDIHSTREIRAEWQHPHVGDRVVLVRPGYAGMAAGYAMRIERIDPPRSLVLRQKPPEHPWDAIWSFHVRPLVGGGCRLISRGRSHRHEGAHGALDVAFDAVMEPVTWFMTRKMLLGIKERAEAEAGARGVEAPQTTNSSIARAV
jgi:hypothetical protein